MSIGSNPLVAMAERLVRDGQRDRSVILKRWQALGDQDELHDLIEEYPEHRDWLLGELKNKIEQGDGDGD